MGPLLRVRKDRLVFHAPVPALEIHPLARPGHLHQFDSLGDTLAALVAAYISLLTECLTGWRPPPSTET